MSSLPTTMLAITQPDPHSPTLTRINTPVPVPTGTEHLLRVAATSPCAGELTWVANFPSLFSQYTLPIVGQDVSGTVVRAPPDSPFPVGTQVYSRVPAFRPGALAEYTIAKQEELARKPESLTLEQAAAVPLSALTAWQGLFEHGGLDAGALRGDAGARERNAKMRVFVTGAGGAVGGWAVQLAAKAGAGDVVAVVGGAEKAEAARKLGASEVVDYKSVGIAEWVKEDPEKRECDLVLGCVAAQLGDCWHVVKEGGVLLSVTIDPEGVKPAGLTKKAGKATWYLVQERGEDLQEIGRLVDEGGVKPVLDSVVEFAQFQEAFDKVESGKTKGKVVIKVAGSV